MVTKFQTYLKVMLRKTQSLIWAFVVFSAFFGAGCATVGSVTTIETKGYNEYVQDIEKSQKLPPKPMTTGFYLHENVKRKVLETSVGNIKKGQIEVADLNLMRKEYLRYARALIEIGEFKKARAVCDEGIQIGNVISKALEQQSKQDAAASLSRNITFAILNSSIEPEDDNGAYLRRLYLYKTYITWFTTGDKQKAFHEFEQFLKTNPLNEDRVFLLMDRGSFYDVIMGDYKKSLNEFLEAAEAVEHMHILNTDMRYVYSLELSAKISDIYVKLGQLDKAEKTLLDGDSQRSGLIYKVGGLIASLQQSKLSIVRSKMGALYALMRDFDTSKKYFDEAFDRVKRLDPNSPDVDQQRALGTYYVYYGAYYLGLKGKYEEAAEQVDNGLLHLKPYFLDAVQNEPNLETAYLHSAELHLFAGENNEKVASQKMHYEKGLAQTREAIKHAKSHRNRVAESAAYTLTGRIYYTKGDKKQAKVAYEKARDLSRKIVSTENWKLFYGLGQVYEDEGKQNIALDYYEQAVNEVEKLWDGRFKDKKKQVSFIDDRLVVFEPVIRILTKQGNSDKAIGYMERSKSRTFFESSMFNIDSGNNGKQADLSPEEAEKAKKLQSEIAEIAEKMESLSSSIYEIEGALGENMEVASSRGVAGTRELKTKQNPEDSESEFRPSDTTGETLRVLTPEEKIKLEKDKVAYEKELKEYEKKLNDLAGEENKLLSKVETKREKKEFNSKPLSAGEIRKMIKPGTALLEYYVGRDSVIGAVITSKKTFARKLEISPKELSEMVMAWHNEFEAIDDNNPPNNDYKGYALDLYARLIKPFEKQLADQKEVGIIPHGVLHYLPFHALLIKDNSEKGIPNQLLDEKKTLLAMLDCSSQRPRRGVGVRTLKMPNREGNNQGEQKEESSLNCSTLAAKRGVKGVREIKDGDKGGQGKIVNVQEVKADLEKVIFQINTERSKKGIKESKPVFFIDKYKLFYAPSSTILNYAHYTNNNKKVKLLAVGDPPPVDIRDWGIKDENGKDIEYMPKLPNAKSEIQKVSSLFADKAVFTGEAATKTIVKNNIGRYDLILFSTHGLLNEKNPLKSTIFFSKDANNDGRLTVADIEGMNFNANLVALSACQTGLVAGYIDDDGRARKDFSLGDDLVGLQQAFIKSGSSSVLSSLWSVNDYAASEFIVDFFERYKRGKDKTTALQEAMLELKKNESMEHPFYWAPFILSGDWK